MGTGLRKGVVTSHSTEDAHLQLLGGHLCADGEVVDVAVAHAVLHEHTEAGAEAWVVCVEVLALKVLSHLSCKRGDTVLVNAISAVSYGGTADHACLPAHLCIALHLRLAHGELMLGGVVLVFAEEHALDGIGEGGDCVGDEGLDAGPDR